MKTVTWVRFTEDDWMGFAGAERFADKSAPYIATVELDGHECIAVLDATGIAVFAEEAVGEDPTVYVLTAKDGNVANAAMSLPEQTTGEALLELGFGRKGGWC